MKSPKIKMISPSWAKIVKLCKEVARLAKGYNADMIVGISRGGLVPTRLISDYLGINNVAIMRVELYTGISQKHEFPIITQPVTVDVKGKKILVVDDVADSGESILAVKKYLREKGAQEVRVATLHYKPHSMVKPEYYSETTSAWINYPWEHEETKRELEKNKK